MAGSSRGMRPLCSHQPSSTPTANPARTQLDGTSSKVRSTLSITERMSLPFGRGNRRDWCSR